MKRQNVVIFNCILHVYQRVQYRWKVIVVIGTPIGPHAQIAIIDSTSIRVKTSIR